eukprot:94718_1
MATWPFVVGFCQIAIGYFIYVPIILYFCHVFKKIPLDSEALKNRNKDLVYWMTLLSILSLALETPFELIVCVFHNDSLGYIATDFFMWSLFLLFTIKSWLLYFNLQYHFSLLKLQWKTEINPRYRSWYILNRNTYGDLKYCLRIITLPFLLYMFIISLLQYLFATDLFIYSSLILSCLVIIPSSALYRRLQSMEDLFDIRKELFYQQTIICVSMGFMISIRLILIILVKYYDLLSKHTTKMVTTLIHAFIVSVAVFLISLNSLCYPAKSHQEHLDKRRDNEDSTTTSSYSAQTMLSVKAMLLCIADRQGFSAFMRHLVQEFATENMLFLCECIQIKYELQRKYKGIIKIKKPQHHQLLNVNENDHYFTIDFNIPNTSQSLMKTHSLGSTFKRSASFDPFGRMESTSVRRGRGMYSFLFMSNGMVWDMIRLPPGLPKAEILNEKHSFVDRMYGLYVKYIKTGSIHEINIPCPQRQTITDIMNGVMQSEYEEKDEYDEIECDMCNVLDEVCIEIIHLMAHSYSRFAMNEKKLIQRINSTVAGLALQSASNIYLDQPTTNDEEPHKLVRNGNSYDNLREEYCVETMQIWPFPI